MLLLSEIGRGFKHKNLLCFTVNDTQARNVFTLLFALRHRLTTRLATKRMRIARILSNAQYSNKLRRQIIGYNGLSRRFTATK